ncbi:MAG: right-handed parallel beta-helix repeat-containing protein [Proteiniphilum sp.]|jgi:hypothetical protein|nr:right-handed parallel beta-helix repeat-containing protein [Proteiniphilum sp.]
MKGIEKVRAGEQLNSAATAFSAKIIFRTTALVAVLAVMSISVFTGCEPDESNTYIVPTERWPGQPQPAIQFSGLSISQNDSAIDKIKQAAEKDEPLYLWLRGDQKQPVSFDNIYDLDTTGLVLNKGSTSPAEVTIDGNSKTIPLKGGNPAGAPLITVGKDVTLTLRNITFNGVEVENNKAPLIKVENGGTLVLAAGAVITGNTNKLDSAGVGGGAGGVIVEGGGTLIMNGGTISKNVGTGNGGGAYVATGGTFTMDNGTISDNKTTGDSSSGGGVYVAGEGIFTTNGGTISGNTAQTTGGGVTVDGSFTMTGGTIGENKAQITGGGGVNVNGGEFTMISGIIEKNEAEGNGHGGGVYMSNGTFSMISGTIRENTANTGGGVQINGGAFSISGTSGIINNIAEKFGGGVYIEDSSFDMTGSVKITGNTVTEENGNGGGVYVNSNGVFTMENGSISGNGIYPNEGYTEDPPKGFGAGVFVDASGMFSKTGGTIHGLIQEYPSYDESQYGYENVELQNYYAEKHEEGVIANVTIAEIASGYAVYYHKDDGFWRDMTAGPGRNLSTANTDLGGWNDSQNEGDEPNEE